jgi:hypothetical protein
MSVVTACLDVARDLPVSTPMNTRPRTAHTATMLHSVFQRGAATLICDLAVSGRRCFDVQVVMGDDSSSGILETFHEGPKAIRRYAELSWLLREDGWERLVEIKRNAAA